MDGFVQMLRDSHAIILLLLKQELSADLMGKMSILTDDSEEACYLQSLTRQCMRISSAVQFIRKPF